MARKARPTFAVAEPSEYNGQKFYADSRKLGMRYGPYETREQAQASVDKLNGLVEL